jgi:hypothetical protein
MSDYNFQKELENSIFNADIKLDRNDLLTDIFKAYVAKLLERVVKGGRVPFDALVQTKNNLINEFRSASLAEYQKSVEQYNELFDNTVKEILNLAALRHSGKDVVQRENQTLQINPEIYIHEGGLIKPVSAL